MNPWHPITSPIDLKHLGKLGEELGEAGAAVSRCIIQGLDGTEPETGKPNQIWLEDELADVLANIQLNCDHFGLDTARMARRTAEKKARLREWHEMLHDSGAEHMQSVVRAHAALRELAGPAPWAFTANAVGWLVSVAAAIAMIVFLVQFKYK